MDEILLRDAVDSILIIDLTGKIISANESANRLYGLKASSLINKRFETLLARESKNEFDIIRERILFNEKIEHFEARRLRKRSEIFTVSVQYSPVKNNAGRIKAISCVEREVTDNRSLKSKSEALLETAPDAMVIVNQFGQIVLTNFQTQNLFGYRKDELLGKNVEILIPNRFLKAHEGHRTRFFKQPKTRGMGTGMELFGQRKDGKEFPVEVSISPLKTEEGTFVSAAIRDITERKKAEAKFKGLLESAPDAIIIVNQEGKIQLVNAQCVMMFGYNRSEILNKGIEILIPARFHKRHVGHRNSYFKNAKLRPMGVGLELLGKRKSGEEFPVEISLSPLETEEGVLVSAAVRDITERKKAELMKQRTLEMEAKNRELEQFAYVASHDLQEPLRTITSFINLLEKKYNNQEDEKTDKYFGYVTGAAQRMRSLITALLEYSRIGQTSKSDKVNCNYIINELKMDLSKLISDSNAVIKARKLPIVQGHMLELKLLFQNLVSNAIKFTKKDTTPVIFINAIRTNGFWKFSVRDNGIGIDAAHYERIFGIFQRLHLATEYPGTGIGLAHCKKVVELHGGKIWLESKVGEGSAFYFTITA